MGISSWFNLTRTNHHHLLIDFLGVSSPTFQECSRLLPPSWPFWPQPALMVSTVLHFHGDMFHPIHQQVESIWPRNSTEMFTSTVVPKPSLVHTKTSLMLLSNLSVIPGTAQPESTFITPLKLKLWLSNKSKPNSEDIEHHQPNLTQ